MSTPARIGAFAAALAVLFGAAFGIGKLFDDEEPTYRLTSSYAPGLLSLSILEGDSVVLEYDVRHEKELHLIAVRKDFGDYRHLHPQFAGSDGWTVPDLTLSPGRWRLYADFQPKGGEPVVAHDDLTVAGTSQAPPRKPITLRAEVDGYEVAFGGRDSLVPGAESAVNFTVTRNGRDVDLEPYLGASGHLVAIREADLEFLHVHPDPGDQPGGGDVPFTVEVTESGRYRLYLEFKHRGVVRTATFVVDAKTGAQLEHDPDGTDHGDH